ncbi:MAG: hypothetical protein DYG92_11830 [Leptolyngbya sp. PLA1]|nr:hypothetical protein [Leptolyngbya sp. PLA1]
MTWFRSRPSSMMARTMAGSPMARSGAGVSLPSMTAVRPEESGSASVVVVLAAPARRARARRRVEKVMVRPCVVREKGRRRQCTGRKGFARSGRARAGEGLGCVRG